MGPELKVVFRLLIFHFFLDDLHMYQKINIAIKPIMKYQRTKIAKTAYVK